MSTTVYCIVASPMVAHNIVHSLKLSGFTEHNISVLFPDKTAARDFALEEKTKAPEGAAAGVTAGGAVGGTLGLLAGLGMLTIPGAGPFLAAGPLMTSLTGVAVGGALGGVAGALIGLGIPEIEATMIEGKMKEGSYLVAVEADSAELATMAKDIFKVEEAKEAVRMKEAVTDLKS